MANDHNLVEQQIERAKAALQNRLDVLKSKSADDKKIERDPVRRALYAEFCKYKKRLVSVDNRISRDEKLKVEKVERLANPQPKKEKTKKVAVAAKGGKDKKQAQGGEAAKKQKPKAEK